MYYSTLPGTRVEVATLARQVVNCLWRGRRWLSAASSIVDDARRVALIVASPLPSRAPPRGHQGDERITLFISMTTPEGRLGMWSYRRYRERGRPTATPHININSHPPPNLGPLYPPLPTPCPILVPSPTGAGQGQTDRLITCSVHGRRHPFTP